MIRVGTKWLLLGTYRQVEMKPSQPMGVQECPVGVRWGFFWQIQKHTPLSHQCLLLENWSQVPSGSLAQGAVSTSSSFAPSTPGQHMGPSNQALQWLVNRAAVLKVGALEEPP